jgi:hypothetical protein
MVIVRAEVYRMGGRMRVLIELRHTRELYTAAVDLQPAATAVYELAAIEGVEVDGSYPPARLPLWERLEEAAPYVTAASLLEPDACAYVLRASIPDDGERVYQQLSSRPDVVGVFSDPTVETCLVCPGDPALGDDNDVADLLDVKTLAAGSLDGTGVRVAVVDTGINMSHLQSMGRTQGLDVANSWTPSGVPTTAGAHPVGHGTMCAFDVGIAAPNAPLLDYAVLLSRTPGATAMSGLLSDAVLAYAQLLSLLSTGTFETLVVTNSWGMFSPTWDFPTGHTGNYSDNPAHPFNVLVASLERAGADICFAAGNCGRDCPDDRCGFSGGPSICGANSHEAITTVAGIDTGTVQAGHLRIHPFQGIDGVPG